MSQNQQPNFASVFQASKGANTKEMLVHRYKKAFAAENGQEMYENASQLVALVRQMQPGDDKDNQMVAGLRMLTMAHFYQNDGVAMQTTLTELNNFIRKITDEQTKHQELCSMFVLSGYAEMMQGNGGYVVIAGEQAVETAEKLTNPDRRSMMISSGLTTQIYGHLALSQADTALEIIEKKIKFIEGNRPEGPQRDLEMETALKLKISSLLMLERNQEAKDVVNTLKKLVPDDTDVLVSSAFIDLANGQASQAYTTAIELFNASLIAERFNHAQMTLLQYAAHEAGKDKDYEGYVALAKKHGLIREDDHTYDALGENPSSERQAQLEDELKDVKGKYARSGMFTTNQITKPINSDAANVAGLRSTPADHYRRRSGDNQRD